MRVNQGVEPEHQKLTPHLAPRLPFPKITPSCPFIHMAVVWVGSVGQELKEHVHVYSKHRCTLVIGSFHM
jgi:hypothetical protein